MNALQELNRLADQRKADKHPNVPKFALVKSRYSDKSANELTAAVVAYFTLKGGWATRIQTQGQYREDLGRWNIQYNQDRNR